MTVARTALLAQIDLLPNEAASGARDVDTLFLGLLAVTGFFALMVIVLIVHFGIKYRAGSKADRSDRVQKTWKWEVTWLIIPTLIALGLFFWSGHIYFRALQPPEDAMVVNVVGKQWMWKFRHPQGPEEINELHVPTGRPIKLLMRSQDVIHSFFVPAFRVKQDVLPNRYTTVWFTAKKPGIYHLFCAEYCGTNHSEMRGRVVVMAPADFEHWLTASGPEDAPVGGTPGALGAPLALGGEGPYYELGCNACHLPSAAVIAPRLDGLFGREVRLRNGDRLTADEQYIRESILEPNAKIVAGYPAPSLMPTYKGQIDEEQLLALIEFIRSIRDGWPAPAASANATGEPAE